MLSKPHAPGSKPGAFLNFTSKDNPMYEQFIELTNQIFWEGYAEQLAQENPARFQMEFNDFINTYQ
ncbi:hypothetical protein [Mucilaginibacter sp. L196]|uniref:hypothetical protein n=1 Tax=Mucilaginibacter sp. L196 TaxID=1641870 RepID=UPI00131DE9E7|nr:hypothetical protein [Mucilaginibacter sp. L196]